MLPCKQKLAVVYFLRSLQWHCFCRQPTQAKAAAATRATKTATGSVRIAFEASLAFSCVVLFVMLFVVLFVRGHFISNASKAAWEAYAAPDGLVILLPSLMCNSYTCLRRPFVRSQSILIPSILSGSRDTAEAQAQAQMHQ